VSAPDALRRALAEVIADRTKEWARERALIEAQAKADVAHVRAEMAELRTKFEALFAERMAAVKDGAPGAAGEKGERGLPGERGQAGPAGEPGPEGKAGPAGARGEAGPEGKPGDRGPVGPAGEKGERGEPGAPGARGDEGAPGKLAVVKEWADGVHYEGDVVARGGSTYQALRDTGREPPHADWRCIAQGGKDGADGRSFTVRGTHAEGETYRHLDVVALNGASFVAKRDNPGACPGDGWQLLAGQGKTGKPGERGDKGDRGAPGVKGEPGPPVVAMTIDGEGLLTLVNADGSVVECDLYPVLAKIAG
jgi:hypothetical protein